MLTADFIKALHDVEILPPDDLRALDDRLGAEGAAGQEAQDVASGLVRASQLTKYQAAAVLAGKAKSLVLGDYVILDWIGAGGMGRVYKARHRRMKRVVALKVLPPAVLKNPQGVKRFQREVEAAAKLLHPNIVTAFDAASADPIQDHIIAQHQRLSLAGQNGGRLILRQLARPN